MDSLKRQYLFLKKLLESFLEPMFNGTCQDVRNFRIITITIIIPKLIFKLLTSIVYFISVPGKPKHLLDKFGKWNTCQTSPVQSENYKLFQENKTQIAIATASF